jgi:hypothetical protein
MRLIQAVLRATTWTTLVILTSVSVSIAASAETDKKMAKPTGEACRSACEKDLRAKGLWDKLPYGTCRKRCGMPL